MLSEKSRPVIEATLPIIGERISHITPKFYARLFAAHPELLDGLFSRANQNNGTQQQALAGSIAAFASHLVNNPGTLPEAVLGPHRPQAHLAGHRRGAVPDRVRTPLRRNRRGPGRRRHPGGRRGMDRGLLAHGRRADQDRKGPVRQAGQRQDLDRLEARFQGRRPAPARSPSALSRPTTPRSRSPSPASSSRSAWRCPTAFASAASTR